jgi:hypothetical protein
MLKQNHLKGFNLAETKIKETDQGECPKFMDFCFFFNKTTGAWRCLPTVVGWVMFQSTIHEAWDLYSDGELNGLR